jgi:hypothetical protein
MGTPYLFSGQMAKQPIIRPIRPGLIRRYPKIARFILEVLATQLPSPFRT